MEYGYCWWCGSVRIAFKNYVIVLQHFQQLLFLKNVYIIVQSSDFRLFSAAAPSAQQEAALPGRTSSDAVFLEGHLAVG